MKKLIIYILYCCNKCSFCSEDFLELCPRNHLEMKETSSQARRSTYYWPMAVMSNEKLRKKTCTGYWAGIGF